MGKREGRGTDQETRHDIHGQRGGTELEREGRESVSANEKWVGKRESKREGRKRENVRKRDEEIRENTTKR